MYLMRVSQVFTAHIIGQIDFNEMNPFKRGVAVIGANPVAMLVVHRRNFQTERPFLPLSLPWCGMYPQGMGERAARELLAVEWRLQQQQLRVEEGCREVAGAREWDRESLFFGSTAACCSVTVAPPVPALSCSGSPPGWSHRGRYILAPATVS